MEKFKELVGESERFEQPGVEGINTAGGDGITGISNAGRGVLGMSEGIAGVFGLSEKAATGVIGSSRNGIGVHGYGGRLAGYFVGDVEVTGWIRGLSVGESAKFEQPGVEGVNTAGGDGVTGISKAGRGVLGMSETIAGVFGLSEKAATGVVGSSRNGIGVHGYGGRLAGFFQGDVEVTGDIRLINAQDIAEDFSVIDTNIEPGTVMVFNNEGSLIESKNAYDKKVAGVISGAGDFKPGMILDKKYNSENRKPIALMGLL